MMYKEVDVVRKQERVIWIATPWRVGTRSLVHIQRDMYTHTRTHKEHIRSAYIYIFTYTFIYIYIHIHLYIYIHKYTRIYTYMYIKSFNSSWSCPYMDTYTLTFSNMTHFSLPKTEPPIFRSSLDGLGGPLSTALLLACRHWMGNLAGCDIEMDHLWMNYGLYDRCSYHL